MPKPCHRRLQRGPTHVGTIVLQPMPALESALSILQAMPCDKEIVQEDERAALADRLAHEVEVHVKQ
jgi:hypothetical protein